MITGQISGGYQEEYDGDYEGGTKGDGAKASDGAVGVARTGRSDDYGGNEGCLFSWSIVRHIWGWWESIRMWQSQESLGISFLISRTLGK